MRLESLSEGAVYRDQGIDRSLIEEEEIQSSSELTRSDVWEGVSPDSSRTLTTRVSSSGSIDSMGDRGRSVSNSHLFNGNITAVIHKTVNDQVLDHLKRVTTDAVATEVDSLNKNIQTNDGSIKDYYWADGIYSIVEKTCEEAGSFDFRGPKTDSKIVNSFFKAVTGKMQQHKLEREVAKHLVSELEAFKNRYEVLTNSTVSSIDQSSFIRLKKCLEIGIPTTQNGYSLDYQLSGLPLLCEF